MNDKIKNRLFIFLLFVTSLPFLRQNILSFGFGKLDGYYTSAADVVFSWHKWLEGTYSEEKASYLNDNVGFRPELLRINNQVDYSLFQKLHAPWLALGKENYLFQTFHIDAYYGNDYVGYQAISDKLRKAKALQDTLARLGKTFIIVHAPCKSFFYPEYIGDGFMQKQQPTNIQRYMELGDSLGINQMDLNGWYVREKNRSKELLFTKQGIHWSVYGSLVAADTFIRYIEQKRNIRMPHPVWTDIIHTHKARDPDDDLAKTMNLMFPFATETFSYPVVTYRVHGNLVKPNIIYIGDSFLDTWNNDGVMRNTSSDWQIWDHFKWVVDRDHPKVSTNYSIDDIDWRETMKQADCIVILNTTISLPVLGHGFIEKAYDYFYPAKQAIAR